MSTSPLCPNPERCGSCGWSHIPYEKQLQQKLSDINGSLKIKELTHRVSAILPSPKTAHYRNRMDFVIDWQGNVGLREKGKWWKVIDDHSCFLADEKIDLLYKKTRDWAKTAGLSYYDRKANVGILRYAVIRSSTIGETMITIVTSAPTPEVTKEKIEKALADLIASANPTTLIWSINNTVTDVSHGEENIVLHGPGTITETIAGFTYRISPNAFFQTNPHGAALLLDTVREFASDLTDKTLLDLYCGTGFFGVALASEAKRTVGVELVADAIRDARINAELNNVTVEFHDAATEAFAWQDIKPDVVIVDPPRAGMHDKALADLLANPPERLIYISCNYKSFARELTFLQEKYDVVAMRAVDMFPHTPHVELVTALVKKA